MARANLTAERIFAQAERLVDESGYDALTMAALAKGFGVAVPSLYKHVPSLGTIRAHMAIQAVRELDAALAHAARDLSKGEALRAMAHAYRAYAIHHPGRYTATLRAPDPHDVAYQDASNQVLQTVFAMLKTYGVAGVAAIDATRALRAALHGFIALQNEHGFGLTQDVNQSFDRLIEALNIAFCHWAQESATEGRPTHAK